VIRTDRLILRGWREADVAPFAAMFRDPHVMRYLGGVPADPDAAARTVIEAHERNRAADGHCFWAMERTDDGALLGFCGLRAGGPGNPVAGTPIADELEIGWRLRHDAWGRGYAREAAAASFAWGWANTRRDRIAAWTVPANIASWGLMIRLGMERRPDLDFDHPFFAPDHPLSRHQVHLIGRPDHG